MENNNEEVGSGDPLPLVDEDQSIIGGDDAEGFGLETHVSSDDDPDWDGSSNNTDWMEGSLCSTTSSTDPADDPSDMYMDSYVPKALQKPKPKHKWSVIKELTKREQGGHPNSQMFCRRYYGSLHAVQRLELMYKLEEHTGCVNAINFNHTGTRLISGSDDRLVALWDWTIGKCLSTFNSGHTSNVFQCKFLPLTGDGHIVTCSRDGQVRMALQNSLGGYESTVRLAQHTRACHKLTTLPQSPHVVLSAGEDALVISVDIRESKPNKLMFVRESNKKISLYSIHANPQSGNEICVAGEDYYVRIYDRRKLKKDGIAHMKFAPHHFVKPFSVYVTCAMFNYNGTEVIGSYNDDDIYLFDPKKGDGSDFVHKYEGHRNSDTVKGVNFFGPRSEFIVSGSDCGNIYFWDKNTESIVQWMRGDEDGVINCLEPHPVIPILATSGLDSDIKIWVPSCEHEPSLVGLDRTITSNHRNREQRNSSTRHSFDSLMRWWRHMRNVERRHMRSMESQQVSADSQQILVAEVSLGRMGSVEFIPTVETLAGDSSSSIDSSSTSADSAPM